ncbi:DUF433 domain-containing protein [Bradyrhizobium liaoningense]
MVAGEREAVPPFHLRAAADERGVGRYLGRFDDTLTTFQQADRYDTPPASRWTWLLGAGTAYALMGGYEEALPWLQRSIAITAGTGRSHFLLAAAYQRLGRGEEARAAIAEGLRLRPGTNRQSVWPPMKNASPICIAAWERVVQAEAVEFIIGLMADGWSEADILANYPGISREDILACLAYAACARADRQNDRGFNLSS